MSDPRVQATWKALGDPTRRALLDRLAVGPETTGHLAAGFPQSRIAVIRHLAVLRDAGLIVSRKRGRERWHYLNAFPLERLWARWLDPTSGTWARSLAALQHQSEDKDDLLVNSKNTALPLAIDLEQQLDIAAPRKRVFHAIAHECAVWWPTEFRSDGAVGLHLDAKLGARFSEDWGGGGGAVLATVTRIIPDELLELSGPLHLGLLVSVTTLALEDFEEGTRLRFSQRAFGHSDPDLATRASQGWDTILSALRDHSEGDPRAD